MAVSKTGAMGSFAAAGSSPDKLAQGVAAIRAATDAPFLVNTFVLRMGEPDPAAVRAGMDMVAPWRERYGLPVQSVPNQWCEPFAPQFAALVEVAPPAASFTFGLLTREEARALKARGTFLIGTATTVQEGKAWAEIGADAICAQGLEAGGHRGTFMAEPHNLVGTFALVRTMVAALDLPVIAAGGITDGAGVAAALALGARAVQVGTAYLRSDESIISPVWRHALETAAEDPTRLTRAISGRFARGIETPYMREMRAVEEQVPAYPVMNALTQELRAAATKAGSPDVLSLWAGQAVKLARPGSAAQITRDLWREAQEVMRQQVVRWG